jgi:hypothetical protein
LLLSFTFLGASLLFFCDCCYHYFEQIENASRKYDAARLWRARLNGLSKELADQCSRALARRRRLRKATRSLVCKLKMTREQ